MEADPTSRVLISYAQYSDKNIALVGEFHRFLRECGVDAHLDPFQVGNLDIAARVQAEDSLIIVASPEYRSIADGDLPVAEQWRDWVKKRIRAGRRQTPTILPVILPGRSADDIPMVLRSKKVECLTISDFSVRGSAALLGLLPPLRPRTRSGNGVAALLLGWAKNTAEKLWHFARVGAGNIRRAARLGNEFAERIGNWFVWAVCGGVAPLLYIWLHNIKEESSLQTLLGNGELFIVSAVLVAATFGELLRERKARSGEATQLKKDETLDEVPDDNKKRITWPSQLNKFACFAAGLGAIAGYGGVADNGPKATMYLSIAVFLLALVTGALIMNGIEKDR